MGATPRCFVSLGKVIKMRVGLIQTSLIWEDPQANRDALESKIREASGAELIVLPEMFTTGFSMNPEAAAVSTGDTTTKWIQALAEELNCAITGSIAIKDNGKYYNRLLFVHPSGKVEQYDKRHLFSLAGEDEVYAPGNQKLIVEFRGWRICPLVCYDIRFPVFSRNVENYDLLLYVANWPTSRIYAWDVLLKARAIENISYVAGVNRVGIDGNDVVYPGHSQILDPLGFTVVAASDADGVFVADLDKTFLSRTRSKLGFLNDMDSFTLN